MEEDLTVVSLVWAGVTRVDRKHRKVVGAVGISVEEVARTQRLDQTMGILGIIAASIFQGKPELLIGQATIPAVVEFLTAVWDLGFLLCIGRSGRIGQQV